MAADISGSDLQRVFVKTLEAVELRERAPGLAGGGIRSKRFAIVGGRSREVANALCGLPGQESCNCVVRPQSDPGLERGKCAPGVALAE